MNSNPLSQYFRQPVIYLRLPSKGEFYPPGSLEMTINGELPVLPMTAVDEITYRTPDALFNGSAVVQVIQSCIPNIKNAWAIPAMDIDTILVAIRIASYGHELDMDTVCPGCAHQEEMSLDLRGVLEKISRPDYNKTIATGDLEIFFKPMTYQDINTNNLQQFEEQKLFQAITEQDEDNPERRKLMGDMLRKITQVTMIALTQSIAAIRTPEVTVVDPEHIVDWLTNCDRTLFNQIRDHIVNTKREAEIQPLKIVCTECSHEYQQTWTLDMTNFFGGAS